MRWTVIILLCLAVVSAKYGKQSRVGKMLQKVADLEKDLESRLQDPWNDDDDESLDESDEDDVWRQPERRHQLSQYKKNQKACPTCHKPKRQPQWTPEDEADEYDESQSEEERTPTKHTKRQHRESDEDEPKQQCRPNYEQIQKLDQINCQLAAKLHQEAKQVSDDKNTVVSPVAVQLALAAVAQGARGRTKGQISQLLGAGSQKNLYQNAYAALVQTLKGQGPQAGSKSAEVKSTTNLVLGQESAQEHFIEAIKTCFDGEVKKCDFRQKSKQCRDQVNQWISTKTGLKQQYPLSESVLTGNTKMISIGTMQVKANWGKQFRKNLKTAQGQFYPLGEQKPTSVKVLQTEGEFNYFEDEQMQVLGIQTQEKQLTVYAILPKTRHGLNQLEKQRLQYGQQLEQLIDRCDNRKQTVKIQLPTFRVTFSMDTKRMLRSVGVEDAFDGDLADFSGVNDELAREHLLKHGRRQTGGLEDIDAKKAVEQQKQHHLHLNKLIQQATIQIDENGLDSSSQGGSSSKSKKSKAESGEEQEQWEREDGTQFFVDHAFAFIVKHNPSNQVLLAGRVIDASQKAEAEKRMLENESE